MKNDEAILKEVFKSNYLNIYFLEHMLKAMYLSKKYLVEKVIGEIDSCIPDNLNPELTTGKITVKKIIIKHLERGKDEI